MTTDGLPAIVADVARQLRRQRFALGIGDYDALRRALAAGFGWLSDDELRRLCVALWAKSRDEAELVTAAFLQCEVPSWQVAAADPEVQSAMPTEPGSPIQDNPTEDEAPRTSAIAGIGAPPRIDIIDRRLVMITQYPLTGREVAQAWRRLRRPLRSGPAVELDVAATVDQRSRSGVATYPILVPRRRNTAKLVLLIDRFGSMTPYHSYVDHVVRAIRNAGRIDDIREAYFHDLPGEADRSVLAEVVDPMRPDLDAVLPLIQPLTGGHTYTDPELMESQPFMPTVQHLAAGTGIVVISDAGSARQQFDAVRLLDTIAMLKALQSTARPLAWLNPVPLGRWQLSTASQVARYVPMFPLTKEGLDRGIDALRGQPALVERPL